MDKMETAIKLLRAHQHGGLAIVKKNYSEMMFQHDEAEDRSEHRTMKNFYYECPYDLLREADNHGANLPALNHIKVKIARLNSTRLKTILLDTTEADNLGGKQPTLHHLIQMKKRRTSRTVRTARYGNGLIQTSRNGIALAFKTFLLSKYDNIEVNPEYICALAPKIQVQRQTNRRRGHFGDPILPQRNTQGHSIRWAKEGAWP
jgi:hypothetical protein